ncbi:MAG: hypothetical protein ACHQF2_10970 [Flavobacteriales bacterium]
MHLRKWVFLALLLLSTRIQGQSDTMFIKYNDIVIGFNLGFANEDSDYSFLAYDSSQSASVLQERDLLFASKINTGLAVKTKYISLYFNIAPLTRWLNDLMSFTVRNAIPTKRNFGFSIFPKQFMLSARYTRTKGALEFGHFLDSTGTFHDSLIEGFRRNHAEISATYFFNRKFSFSRAHSLLYFPKKSMFTLLLHGAGFWQQNHNGENAFIASDLAIIYKNAGIAWVYNWNHARLIEYYGFQVLPGMEFYLIQSNRKTIARLAAQGRLRKKGVKELWLYYHTSVKGGPVFYKAKLEAVDPTFNNSQNGMGLTVQANVKLGVNMRHYNMEVNILYFTNRFELSNFNEKQKGYAFNLLYAFRIPFTRGYEKIDARAKRLFGKE